MSANKASGRGLGRGLDALFGGGAGRFEGQNSVLSIDDVVPNPDQPRRHFDETALKELSASIAKEGILQPLLVRPAADGLHQIVSGERRWRAARMAGLKQVPVVIREMDDNAVLAASLVENLQRESLNPMEEARAMKRIIDALGCSQQDLADRLGKSRPSVANTMRMLQLSEAAQEDLINGRISAGHARCLLALEDDPEAADILRRRIVGGGITVRAAEDAVEAWRRNGALPDAPDADPQDDAGADDADPADTSDGRIPARRRRRPRWIAAVQKQIGRTLCRAGICGDANAGRITLRYGSGDELRRILERLGVDASAVEDGPAGA